MSNLTITPVWGTRIGLCAWCNKKAVVEYLAKDSTGDVVSYQVCVTCLKERV
jgi:hypothetical protein